MHFSKPPTDFAKVNKRQQCLQRKLILDSNEKYYSISPSFFFSLKYPSRSSYNQTLLLTPEPTFSLNSSILITELLFQNQKQQRLITVYHTKSDITKVFKWN